MTTVPMNDLNNFHSKKDGLVESVTIDGKYSFEEDDVFPKDANVLIMFYSRYCS